MTVGDTSRFPTTPAGLPHRVAQAASKLVPTLTQAAQRAGVNFDALFHTARLESGFNANARAVTSSATGLFQFIDSTWMGMVRRYGEQMGLKGLTRSQALALRNDPAIASQMAALHMADNSQLLESATGRAPNTTDLYMAHFLGAAGASKFLRQLSISPQANAAEMFPAAAKANRAIFYKNGYPRTLSEVYSHFDHKIHGNPNPKQAAILSWAKANNANITTGSIPSNPATLLPKDTTVSSADAAKLAYLLLADMGG